MSEGACHDGISSWAGDTTQLPCAARLVESAELADVGGEPAVDPTRFHELLQVFRCSTTQFGACRRGIGGVLRSAGRVLRLSGSTWRGSFVCKKALLTPYPQGACYP